MPVRDIINAHLMHRASYWPHSLLLYSCKRYWTTSTCDSLTMDDDFIIHGCRLLILTRIHSKVHAQLLESHQGSVRTKQWGSPVSLLAWHWQWYQQQHSLLTAMSILPSYQVTNHPKAHTREAIPGDHSRLLITCWAHLTTYLYCGLFHRLASHHKYLCTMKLMHYR